MRKLDKHVIHCPKKEKHPKNKILLLLGEEDLIVHCPIHGWLKIELMRAGTPINFKNVSAKITEIHKKTDFNLEYIPIVTLGSIQEKRHAPQPV